MKRVLHHEGTKVLQTGGFKTRPYNFVLFVPSW
jgi:hypothetical protein